MFLSATGTYYSVYSGTVLSQKYPGRSLEGPKFPRPRDPEGPRTKKTHDLTSSKVLGPILRVTGGNQQAQTDELLTFKKVE